MSTSICDESDEHHFPSLRVKTKPQYQSTSSSTTNNNNTTIQNALELSKSSTQQSTTSTPSTTTIFCYFTSSLCAAINHHSYLLIVTLILFFFSQHVNPLLPIVSILHLLCSGALASILIGMKENPNLSRAERLKRQHGHSFMLANFAGVGSLAEVYRYYVQVEGVTPDNVLRSIFLQFVTISPIKIILLAIMYSQFTTALNVANNNNDIILSEKLYHMGYATFLVLISTFILTVIAYVFTTKGPDNENGVENDDFSR